MIYHPISMQAPKPVREDEIVASHKVASVKINHTCNDTILITISIVHFWSHEHIH